jgi:hypothetical protein
MPIRLPAVARRASRKYYSLRSISPLRALFYAPLCVSSTVLNASPPVGLGW